MGARNFATALRMKSETNNERMEGGMAKCETCKFWFLWGTGMPKDLPHGERWCNHKRFDGRDSQWKKPDDGCRYHKKQ